MITQHCNMVRRKSRKKSKSSLELNLQNIFKYIVTGTHFVSVIPFPQEYKPPTALDIPADLRVTLLPNAKNPYGVLGSKGKVKEGLGWIECWIL